MTDMAQSRTENPTVYIIEFRSSEGIPEQTVQANDYYRTNDGWLVFVDGEVRVAEFPSDVVLCIKKDRSRD